MKCKNTTILGTFVFDVKYIASLAFICTILVSVSGCAHVIRFQTVDANTRRPLPNVSIRWTKVRYHGLFDFDANSVELPKTDADGSATVTGAKEWQNFKFDCSGYWPADAVLLPRGKIDIISPDKLKDHEGSALTNAVKISFPVVVEMFPQ